MIEEPDSAQLSEPADSKASRRATRGLARDSATRQHPPLIRIARSVMQMFTSYPLQLEREALANLRALRGGPTTVRALAEAVFNELHGPERPVQGQREADARQAFLQLVQLGAIACRKYRKTNGAWEEITLTPTGAQILADPADWFDAGHLRRSPRRKLQGGS